MYQSKYVPTQGCFKQLTEVEEGEAKTAFAAGARSERLSLAYHRSFSLARSLALSLSPDFHEGCVCVCHGWQRREYRVSF